MEFKKWKYEIEKDFQQLQQILLKNEFQPSEETTDEESYHDTRETCKQNYLEIPVFQECQIVTQNLSLDNEDKKIFEQIIRQIKIKNTVLKQGNVIFTKPQFFESVFIEPFQVLQKKDITFFQNMTTKKESYELSLCSIFNKQNLEELQNMNDSVSNYSLWERQQNFTKQFNQDNYHTIFQLFFFQLFY